MLEARLPEAAILKRVLDSITSLLTDANFDCSEDGIRLQAMDNSHIALSSVELRAEGFDPYRCDRPMTIGVSLASLTKIVKSANNEDILTLRKDETGDILTLTFESAKTDRIAEYDLKLMDIDAEHLDIPTTEYDAMVTMSSAEFGRIMRDLSNVGESVVVDVQKETVTFSTEGEIGAAHLTLKQGTARGGSGGAGASSSKVKIAKEEQKEEEDEEEEEEDDDVKPSKRAKREAGSGDEKEEEEEEDTKKRKRNGKKLPSDDEDEEEEDRKPSPKKASAAAKGGKGSGKRGRSGKEDAAIESEVPVQIQLTQAVRLTFSVKYLSAFSKAAPLAAEVKLRLGKKTPLLVEFSFENGHVQFYLAPKLADDEDDDDE